MNLRKQICRSLNNFVTMMKLVEKMGDEFKKANMSYFEQPCDHDETR